MYFEQDREFEARDELREKRKDIHDFHGLATLIKEVEQRYNVGYGTAPRSVAQATIATFEYLSNEMGLTGFQAACALWDVIHDIKYPNNKAGLKLINYDDMLYPQYEDDFKGMNITRETMDALQKEAKRLLKEAKGCVAEGVRKHWKSLAKGKVPFGCNIID